MIASPLRYFLIVGLHPPHHLAVLTGVTVVGLWTVALSPGELDSAFGMVLFVQMFLASTGWLTRARRGHFDPILTSDHGRIAVIVSHWFASVLPGTLAWGIVSGVDWASGGAPGVSALVGHRLLAFAIVSAVSWTAGFALTRGAAGALWAAGLVAVLLQRADLLGASSTAVATAPVWLVVRHATAVVVCPFLLLGSRPPLAPGSAAGAGCAAALALLLVCRSADRFDVYLRDRT